MHLRPQFRLGVTLNWAHRKCEIKLKCDFWYLKKYGMGHMRLYPVWTSEDYKLFKFTSILVQSWGDSNLFRIQYFCNNRKHLNLPVSLVRMNTSHVDHSTRKAFWRISFHHLHLPKFSMPWTSQYVKSLAMEMHFMFIAKLSEYLFDFQGNWESYVSFSAYWWQTIP